MYDEDGIYIGTEGPDYFDGNGTDVNIAYGNGGDDVLVGGRNYDELYGGDGNDDVDGGDFDDQVYGDAGNDLVSGGAGLDSVYGGAGDDYVSGGRGDDSVLGEDGNDTVSGDDGNDSLSGGAGDDILYGGPGRDSLNGGDGFDLVGFNVIGFSGAVPTRGVVLDLAANTVSDDGFGLNETIALIEGVVSGTRFADSYAGSDGHNYFYAETGDTVLARGGDDNVSLGNVAASLDGGDGYDTVDGFADRSSSYPSLAGTVRTAGVEVNLQAHTMVDLSFGTSGTILNFEAVHGSSFDDMLTGDARANALYGEGGNDVLRGLDGGDLLDGGAGDDLLRGGAGIDSYIGGDGVDRVSFFIVNATQGVVADLRTLTVSNDGFGQSETMSSIEGLGGGTRFADTFYGDDNANLLFAGGGDTVQGFGGDDHFQVDDAPLLLDGGAGIDAIDSFTQMRQVDSNGDGISEYVTTEAGVVVNLTTGGILNDGWSGWGVIRNIENLGGSEGNDILTGSALANILKGHGGSDTLAGMGGADILYGEDGDDYLDGGAGDDVLIGGLGYNTMIGGAGNDLLTGMAGAYDQASYATATAAVQVDLALTGPQNTGGAGIDTFISIEDLAGSRYADLLSGDANGNVIYGGAGADRIFGRDGGDLVFGDSGDDQISGGNGNDTLNGGVGLDVIHGDNNDDIIDGGDSNDTLYGDGGNDTLIGGAGNDVLDGGSGNDILNGGAGADTLYGGLSADTLDGGDGNDTLWGGASNDTLRGGAGVDILNGEDGVDYLYGGDSNDTLDGGIGADQLFGEAGSDTLRGGDGVDRLTGGLGKDSLTGGEGNDRFIFTDITDSTVAAAGRDTITDLASGDLIDLSAIDANSLIEGNQAFVRVAAFTGVAGQLTLTAAGANTVLSVDVNGDGVADMAVTITGAHTDFLGFVF